jgi:hypothetical protein
MAAQQLLDAFKGLNEKQYEVRMPLALTQALKKKEKELTRK